MDTQQSVHSERRQRESHTHYHRPSSSRNPTDHGLSLMRLLGIMQQATAHGSKWMSDYRSTRLIPASNHVILATILALLGGAFLAYNLPTGLKGLGRAVVIAASVLLAVFVIGGLGLTRFIRRQRAIVRRMVIDSIPWQGTESVLDVGCGTGMLLNGCAQRLTTGKAIGVDLWQEPVAGTPNVLMQNARAEGVADKVDYHEMDARHLTFEDASFNVVVSSLALHHIGNLPEDREQAVAEMIRVLAPGGYLSLVDIGPMIDIAEAVITQSSLQIVRREQDRFFRLLTARKA